ncbi:MAG TPA: TonB family protein [Gammaproteobacteria bacterium]
MLAIRAPFSAVGGAFVATAMFLGLSKLVGGPLALPPVVEKPVIEFKRPRVDTPVDIKRNEKPKREAPVLQPGVPGLRAEGNGDNFGVGDIVRPPIAPPGPPRTKLTRGIDGDVIPIVQTKPEYPPRAQSAGIEGWVRVQFSVTSVGTVRDAVVVESEPGTTFDEAALKAIARWRYNPRVENGEAVERVGVQAIIRFTLEN